MTAGIDLSCISTEPLVCINKFNLIKDSLHESVDDRIRSDIKHTMTCSDLTYISTIQ